MKPTINLFPDTIRDSLQAEAITKEVPVNQVFDFSYLPARQLHQKKSVGIRLIDHTLSW
jgi:hypothetical protein